MTQKVSSSCSFSLKLIGADILSALIFIFFLHFFGPANPVFGVLLILLFPPFIGILPYLLLKKVPQTDLDKKIIITTLLCSYFWGILVYPSVIFLLNTQRMIMIWIIIGTIRYFLTTGLFFSSIMLFRHQEDNWLTRMILLWSIDFLLCLLLPILRLHGFTV